MTCSMPSPLRCAKQRASSIASSSASFVFDHAGVFRVRRAHELFADATRYTVVCAARRNAATNLDLIHGLREHVRCAQLAQCVQYAQRAERRERQRGLVKLTTGSHGEICV